MASVTPNKGTAHTVVIIGYAMLSSYVPHAGYCRFGPSITAAHIIGNDSLSCEVPVDVFGFVKVSVSFDSLSWSQEIFNFEIERNMAALPDLPWPVIGFAAFCVLGLIVYGCVRRKAESSDASDDAPLVDSRAPKAVEGKRKTKTGDPRPRKRGQTP
jgi:hypothetical protein